MMRQTPATGKYPRRLRLSGSGPSSGIDAVQCVFGPSGRGKVEEAMLRVSEEWSGAD